MKRTKNHYPATASARRKRSRGRPPKYNPDFHPQATKKLCEMGATVDQLADAFTVAISTIYQWSITYPDFSEACRVGNEAANAKVERSYYERATGYSYDTVKIFMPSGSNKPVYAPYRQHVPAEPRCGEFWMTRRNPEKWGLHAPTPGDDLVTAFFNKLFATVETKSPVEDDPRFLIGAKQPVTIDHDPAREPRNQGDGDQNRADR